MTNAGPGEPLPEKREPEEAPEDEMATGQEFLTRYLDRRLIGKGDW